MLHALPCLLSHLLRAHRSRWRQPTIEPYKLLLPSANCCVYSPLCLCQWWQPSWFSLPHPPTLVLFVPCYKFINLQNHSWSSGLSCICHAYTHLLTHSEEWASSSQQLQCSCCHVCNCFSSTYSDLSSSKKCLLTSGSMAWLENLVI